MALPEIRPNNSSRGLHQLVSSLLQPEVAHTNPEVELRSFERRNIENALEQSGWKIYGKAGATALLGIQPTTLASRMQRMGIKKVD